MERKIVKMGNSFGSTYPAEILNHLHAKQGDHISFEPQPDGTVIIKKQSKVQLPKGIDPGLLEIVTDVMDQYNEAIKELAKK
ncbi:AbrB family transcriptional regulator [Sporolactobacillus sp. STCC-11]|uniref:AbrB family transcriptional regulator n=1 Tax=Sporolactobacillus caesalpiniae TaxID=3230362 RepID=UPI003391B3F9